MPDGPGTEDEEAFAIAALRSSMVTGRDVASTSFCLNARPSYFGTVSAFQMFFTDVRWDADMRRVVHEVVLGVLGITPIYFMVGEEVGVIGAQEPLSRVCIAYRQWLEGVVDG